MSSSNHTITFCYPRSFFVSAPLSSLFLGSDTLYIDRHYNRQIYTLMHLKTSGVNIFLFCPQDDISYLYLAENLRVPKNLYERIAEISDYKKYTSALLMMLFDRETLATHSLQGRKNSFSGEDCHKPQLPPDILRSIIGKI